MITNSIPNHIQSTKMKNTIIPSLITLASLASSPGAVILFANQNIPIPTNFDGVYIDIDTGDTTTSSGGGAAYDINFFFGGEGISNDAYSAGTAPTLQLLGIDDNSTSDNFEAVVNLAPDATQTVGPTPTTGTFTTGYGGSGFTDDHLGTGVGQFEPGVKGFLGFSVQLSGQTHYGFFDVTLTNNGAGTINGWAYESTPNTPIVVIPEPSTGLLALASLTLLSFRRRR